MFTNKPEFRVKEVIQLSKLSSEVLNDLLKEANVYLTKRILTYVLAQQISIQIASDRELVHLRGYASELEDYTLLQLLNFTDAQGIEIDTFDIKFRLWTVIFSNLRELSIRDSWIQRYLDNNEPHFEYTQDLFESLTRFIDEPNDVDGQPFIIAKESLTRFSSREEVEALAKSIGVELPTSLDKEGTINVILRDLEDTNPDLKNELMKKNLKEINEFARENYVSTDFKLTKKELVNYILDNYDQLDEHIRNIEYQKHLEIPSLYKYQAEEKTTDTFKPNKVFDQELKEMIATIISGEAEEVAPVTEEESKEELEKVMDEIAQTYTPPKREEDQILLKRIDELERRLQEKNNYDPNMIALMNKISHLETQFNPNTVSREDMLMKKIEGLENKITRLARGENPDVSEAKQVEQNLLNRISELEEKLSFQKDERYIDRMTPQATPVYVAPVIEEQPVHTEPTPEPVVVKEPEPIFVDADDDYEYDIAQFVPRTPVTKPEVEEPEEVEEEVLDAAEEVEVASEPVIEEKNSEIEEMLLAKLAEIEEKLEARDTEIEALKEEVELTKVQAAEREELALEREASEIASAKLAQEEAERKLEEQTKELNVLRFLSKGTKETPVEELDELLELESLDPYNVDELEDVEAMETEEDFIKIGEETESESTEDVDEQEMLEELPEEAEELEELEETEAELEESFTEEVDDDSVDGILAKLGIGRKKKKTKKQKNEQELQEALEELEESFAEEEEALEVEEVDELDEEVTEEKLVEELDEDVTEEKLVEELEDDSELEEDFEETEEIAEELESEDETLEEIMDDIEELEDQNDEEYGVLEEEEEPLSEFDQFIEEIHSSKNKDVVKARRRHTLKPVQVFWKALLIWGALVIVAGIIVLVYNNL